MRSNLTMTFDDIVGRMPKTSSTRTKGNISMRATRFRHSEGLIAWSPRMGSEGIKRYMDLIMGDARLQTNTTYDFPGLSPWERIGIKIVNYCKHTNRVRGASESENKKRKLADIDERRKRYEDLWKEYLDKRESAGITGMGDKPTRYLRSIKPQDLLGEDDEEEDKEALQPPSPKRAYKTWRPTNPSVEDGGSNDGFDFPPTMEFYDHLGSNQPMSRSNRVSLDGYISPLPTPSIRGTNEHGSSPLTHSLHASYYHHAAPILTPPHILYSSAPGQIEATSLDFGRLGEQNHPYGIYHPDLIDSLPTDPFPTSSRSASFASEAIQPPLANNDDAKSDISDDMKFTVTPEESPVNEHESFPR